MVASHVRERRRKRERERKKEREESERMRERERERERERRERERGRERNSCYQSFTDLVSVANCCLPVISCIPSVSHDYPPREVLLNLVIPVL